MAETRNQIVRVALYARRSPDDKSDEACANQIEILRQAVKQRQGWRVEAEVVDSSMKGADFSRDGIRRLTGLIEAGKINAVIAQVLDRYHRDGFTLHFRL